MPARSARQFLMSCSTAAIVRAAARANGAAVARTGLHISAAALLIALGSQSLQTAIANGDTRTLTFHHVHTGEDITITYKRDGRYDQSALKKLNWFMRDWRRNESVEMNPQLFDILWEAYREVGGKQPIEVICGYRSPDTNAMLRRRSSGVAKASQHTQGNAMDFFIPGVSLELLRNVGLRLQRGGVGFYPTSGSPFVHLDTGSVRHWPRMSYDQLAKVFPDGRTVHQSTSGPMKGYELARADIERRGDIGETQVATKSTFLAALFKGKSAGSDEDDEAAAAPAPAKIEKPVKTTVVAATKPEKPAKPAASTLQLASADAKIVPAPKPGATASAAVEAKPQAAAAEQPSAAPQTPADIINARGFWDNIPAPQQASPAQVAALAARKADPQPTASVTENFNRAMAYAPAAVSPVDRANIVAASAPIPRSGRAASSSRNSMAVNDVTTVVAKGARDDGNAFATSARLAASKGNNEIWLRVMMLAPSASTSMSVTVFGDADLTLMRQHFVKPQAIVAMTFSADPTLGLVTDRFTGSATARLDTMSFVMRTAAPDTTAPDESVMRPTMVERDSCAPSSAAKTRPVSTFLIMAAILSLSGSRRRTRWVPLLLEALGG